MKKRAKRKSRVRTESIRIVIKMPDWQEIYAEPPGYSGHNGGIFQDAGYRSGGGQFGFRHGH